MTQEDDMIEKELLDLLHQSKWLSLASINPRQEPEASLIPYILMNNTLWVFVSALASHTENLTGNPRVSVLVASEEQHNAFAIQRVSLQCVATTAVDSKEEVLNAMTQKFGETVTLLRKLPDFRLFALKPVMARYIKGFGQAYEVDWSMMKVSHIDPSK